MCSTIPSGDTIRNTDTIGVYVGPGDSRLLGDTKPVGQESNNPKRLTYKEAKKSRVGL